jgi:hypothetical protein
MSIVGDLNAARQALGEKSRRPDFECRCADSTIDVDDDGDDFCCKCGGLVPPERAMMAAIPPPLVPWYEPPAADEQPLAEPPQPSAPATRIPARVWDEKTQTFEEIL